MIDLHYAPTPNGWKISIMLEELGLPYKVIPVNIRAGEQFKPGISGDQPEQPDSRDRRSRAGRRRRAVLGVRDRRNPDLSRRQDRPLPADGNARPLQSDPVGDVADGRAWAHARPARPFRALCGGEDSLCHRALSRRGGAALSRARHAIGQDRGLCRRRLFDRRHRLLSLDHDPQGAGLYARRLSEHQALVRRSPRPAAGAGGAGDRQIREGAVRRGGAAQHVRPDARRRWWGKGKSRRVVIASRRVARSARDDRLRQAIHRATRGKNGLLRRCAPRNDAETTQVSIKKETP